MFLRLPYKGRCSADKLWKELNRRNRCYPKLCVKLLSVLIPRKIEQKKYIEIIDEHKNLWSDKSQLDNEKVIQFLNNNQDQLMITASKTEIPDFQAIPANTKLV